MVANNRLDNHDDSGSESDESEIYSLVRTLQKTLLRKANKCADANIIGEALSLSEGARSAGEIICQMSIESDVTFEGDDDESEESN